MLKHIYRLIILSVIFVFSVLLMAGNIKEEEVKDNATTKMGNATFPVVYTKYETEMINPLHGYSSNFNSNMVRESINLVDTEQSIIFAIKENAFDVKKLDYELRKSGQDEIFDEGRISALEKESNYKTVRVKIKEELEEKEEYTLKLKLITSTGKKIYYYTRIKKIENANLEQELSFVNKLHQSILSKKDTVGVKDVLETNGTMDNKTFSHVTIHSSYEMVMWGELKPRIISEVSKQITELNEETASFLLRYQVEVETSTGAEQYEVNEFFRVKYTPSRMYLLFYDRKVDSYFNPKLISVKKKELKLGLSNDSSFYCKTDPQEAKVAFVKNRELWFYDTISNVVTKVFSFKQTKSDFVRDCYNEHSVKILNIDADGNIDFIIYGYMNRGEYEGRNAAILYRYYAVENRIEEQTYIPLNWPYDIIKDDLSDFSYVTTNNIFYFSLEGKIYAYNLITKQLETVIEKISPDRLLIANDNSYIAWSKNADLKKSDVITILDLETAEKVNVKAKEGTSIRILGKVNDNIILGYIKSSSITTDVDGSIIAPAYRVEIIDKKNNVLKKYEKKGYYTFDVKLEDNVIELIRGVKDRTKDNSYKEAESDYILNYHQQKDKKITVSTRVTDKMLTEEYLTLPSSIELTQKPEIKSTVNTIIKEDKTIRVADNIQNEERYYVYAYGELYGVYDTAGEAITVADENMGMVVNQEYKIAWERGNRKPRRELTSVEEIYEKDGLKSQLACVKMVTSYSGVNVRKEQLVSTKWPIMGYLQEYMKKTPINLTGCTLNQVLYYVSMGQPVIAMKNGKDAVLIVAYDEFNITMVDPAANKKWKEGFKDSSKLFEGAGNTFISYLE